VSGVRVLRGTEDNDGQPARVHLIVQPRGAVAGEHIHPRIREGFQVISGRLGTRVDGGRADPYRWRGGSGRAGHVARLLEPR
jgi:quercetin dioxygenase-like cupin family protein